jgi:hypothetical protein
LYTLLAQIAKTIAAETFLAKSFAKKRTFAKERMRASGNPRGVITMNL